MCEEGQVQRRKGKKELLVELRILRLHLRCEEEPKYGSRLRVGRAAVGSPET